MYVHHGIDMEMNLINIILWNFVNELAVLAALRLHAHRKYQNFLLCSRSNASLPLGKFLFEDHFTKNANFCWRWVNRYGWRVIELQWKWEIFWQWYRCHSSNGKMSYHACANIIPYHIYYHIARKTAIFHSIKMQKQHICLMVAVICME